MELSGKSRYLGLKLNWFFRQLRLKILALFFRLIDVFYLLPLRFYRLLKHLWSGVMAFVPQQAHRQRKEIKEYTLLGIINWFTEFVLYFLDCFGFSEFYETIMDGFKFNSRPLHDWEIKLAQSVFGNHINYKRVRIDEYAFIGPRQQRFCYVSFYIINSWGIMRNSLLLHELTHVWQFQHFGAVYISRALTAQHSKAGYNYGGVSNLIAYLKEGKSFFSFNLEQQGDLVADYYRIREGLHPYWGKGTKNDLATYETFIQQMQAPTI